jgi:HAD superfamily hydrolase (TIGR01490 family)
MNIAFFDFDGTITTHDTLIDFIRFARGNIMYLIGMIILSPILFLYKVRLIPNYTAKRLMLSWFFRAMNEENFKAVAKSYSLKKIDLIVRPEALERIQWHMSRGDHVVVVSASLEDWVKPWCEQIGLEVIATRFAFEDGKFSGQNATHNCYGLEKVNRIREQYILDQYECIYAYGDSAGDREMLLLAHEKKYKPFR